MQVTAATIPASRQCRAVLPWSAFKIFYSGNISRLIKEYVNLCWMFHISRSRSPLGSKQEKERLGCEARQGYRLQVCTPSGNLGTVINKNFLPLPQIRSIKNIIPSRGRLLNSQEVQLCLAFVKSFKENIPSFLSFHGDETVQFLQTLRYSWLKHF